MKAPHIPVPTVTSDYVHVYIPKSDVYRGVTTEHFSTGERYPEWITNDFSIIHDSGMWHMVGITHPRVPGFVDALDYEGDIHEAEYQLFHCTAAGESFTDVFFEDAFCECEKLLYPAERPGERHELWAPHLMKHEGKYNIIYSPEVMRRAVSDDWQHWDTAPLFRCANGAARDPYIFCEDGKFYMVYTEARQLLCRTSENLADWSEPFVLQRSLFACENESPFLMKREGYYYLFWSCYDGKNGSYDERTYVFAADTLAGLYDSAPITMLRAHAPEIVQSPDGAWYLLSAFYPENGVNAAKLEWK